MSTSATEESAPTSVSLFFRSDSETDTTKLLSKKTGHSSSKSPTTSERKSDSVGESVDKSSERATKKSPTVRKKEDIWLIYVERRWDHERAGRLAVSVDRQSTVLELKQLISKYWQVKAEQLQLVKKKKRRVKSPSSGSTKLIRASSEPLANVKTLEECGLHNESCLEAHVAFIMHSLITKLQTHYDTAEIEVDFDENAEDADAKEAEIKGQSSQLTSAAVLRVDDSVASTHTRGIESFSMRSDTVMTDSTVMAVLTPTDTTGRSAFPQMEAQFEEEPLALMGDSISSGISLISALPPSSKHYTSVPPLKSEIESGILPLGAGFVPLTAAITPFEPSLGVESPSLGGAAASGDLERPSSTHVTWASETSDPFKVQKTAADKDKDEKRGELVGVPLAVVGSALGRDHNHLEEARRRSLSSVGSSTSATSASRGSLASTSASALSYGVDIFGRLDAGEYQTDNEFSFSDGGFMSPLPAHTALSYSLSTTGGGSMFSLTSRSPVRRKASHSLSGSGTGPVLSRMGSVPLDDGSSRGVGRRQRGFSDGSKAYTSRSARTSPRVSLATIRGEDLSASMGELRLSFDSEGMVGAGTGALPKGGRPLGTRASVKRAKAQLRAAPVTLRQSKSPGSPLPVAIDSDSETEGTGSGLRVYEGKMPRFAQTGDELRFRISHMEDSPAKDAWHWHRGTLSTSMSAASGSASDGGTSYLPVAGFGGANWNRITLHIEGGIQLDIECEGSGAHSWTAPLRVGHLKLALLTCAQTAMATMGECTIETPAIRSKGFARRRVPNALKLADIKLRKGYIVRKRCPEWQVAVHSFLRPVLGFKEAVSIPWTKLVAFQHRFEKVGFRLGKHTLVLKGLYTDELTAAKKALIKAGAKLHREHERSKKRLLKTERQLAMLRGDFTADECADLPLKRLMKLKAEACAARRQLLEVIVRKVAKSGRCVLCQKAACEMVLGPCNHQCVCRKCCKHVLAKMDSALRLCPVCEEPIKSWLTLAQ